jgi:hypothetical protein
MVLRLTRFFISLDMVLRLKHFGEHTPGEYINILANRDAANPAQNPYQIVPGVGQTPSF